MSKIVGIKYMSFKGNDGADVNGMRLFLTEPMEKTEGDGIKTDSVFLSSGKLNNMAYKPVVGDVVRVLYNRYGKVDCIEKQS